MFLEPEFDLCSTVFPLVSAANPTTASASRDSRMKAKICKERKLLLGLHQFLKSELLVTG
jgi:hypothetical protein